MGMLIPKLRASAKGQRCTFEIVGHCNGDPATTVLCHAPSEIKGAGNKSHDFHAAFGCSGCHEALDQHKLSWQDALFYWLRGCQRTLTYWVNAGLIVVPADLSTVKTRPGRKAKMPSRKIASRNTLRRAEPKEAPHEH